MANVPSAFNDPFEMLYRSPDSVSWNDAKKFVKLMERSSETYEAAKRKHPEIKNRKDFKKFWKVKKREIAENYIRDFRGSCCVGIFMRRGWGGGFTSSFSCCHY